MEERIHRRQEEPRAATDPTLSSGDDESTDGEEEFEFPSFLGADHGSPALADDLFADGRIRPAAFYPVFGRPSAGSVNSALAAPEAPAPERRTRGQLGRLFLEESGAWNSSSTSSSSSTESSSSSTATDDLESAAPETYCVWRARRRRRTACGERGAGDVLQGLIPSPRNPSVSGVRTEL